MSHPTWVRGLKQYQEGTSYQEQKVAPYVGAWIETRIPFMKPNSFIGRTLRGCVD